MISWMYNVHSIINSLSQHWKTQQSNILRPNNKEANFIYLFMEKPSSGFDFKRYSFIAFSLIWHTYIQAQHRLTYMNVLLALPISNKSLTWDIKVAVCFDLQCCLCEDLVYVILVSLLTVDAFFQGDHISGWDPDHHGLHTGRLHHAGLGWFLLCGWEPQHCWSAWISCQQQLHGLSQGGTPLMPFLLPAWLKMPV